MIRQAYPRIKEGFSEAPASRQTRLRRKAAIGAIRKSAGKALLDIDEILQSHGGQRLARTPDALGCIPVEATTAGIKALGASKYVKAIFEDQPISLLK